ncbi:COQ9-domain-containing protein [Diaporthe sp. PMI_573]|nr:COQ9-domain-containing protein [Diaporthaceae sp. PMI_573]
MPPIARRLTSCTASYPTTAPPTPANLPRASRSRRPQLSGSPSALSSHRRSYHSYDHPGPAGPFSPTERAILAAAYAHVPQHGFTPKTLALGARDAGYLDISTNLLADGVFTLVQWHLVSQREALAAKAKALFEAGEARALGVRAKVELLTWERLMGNKHAIGKLQEALAIMAQPSYVQPSLGELARLSDEIWFLVGDTAVDPSWYTKRASLSAIYASTELFMTTDHSSGFHETRKFLQRRLAETHEIGGTLRSIGTWVGFTASAGLNVLRSKGVRI